jgi:hypothetical protein
VTTADKINSVIAGLAVLTFLFGVIVFTVEVRRRRQDLNKEMDAAKRLQASLFDCWVEGVIVRKRANSSRFIDFSLVVSNASAQTLRNVDVWLCVQKAAEPIRRHLATISPTNPPTFHVFPHLELDIPTGEYEHLQFFLPGVVLVSAWFVDASGVHWHRRNDGTLKEEKNLNNDVTVSDL